MTGYMPNPKLARLRWLLSQCYARSVEAMTLSLATMRGDDGPSQEDVSIAMSAYHAARVAAAEYEHAHWYVCEGDMCECTIGRMPVVKVSVDGVVSFR